MSLTFNLLNDFHPLFRLMQDPFQSHSFPTNARPSSNLWLQRQASVELTEDGNDIVVRAEVPGVQKENLDIHLGGDGQSLSIEGKVRRVVKAPTSTQVAEPEQSASGNTAQGKLVSLRIYPHFSYLPSGSGTVASKSSAEPPTESEFRSSFTRSLWLPHRVDGQKASAELKDGVLTLRIPKADEAAHRITIN